MLNTTRQNAALRRKWRRWLNRLQPELSDLVVSRHIYLRVRAIVLANREIQKPHDFHTWTNRNYLFSCFAAIRRLTDTRRDVVSLARLLDDIRRCPRAITRRSHVSRYPRGIRRAGHRWFDKVAGAGQPFLPATVPQQDLERIKAAESGIRCFVNKRVAHLDQKNVRRWPPDFREIDTAIDILEQVFLRYKLLLTRSAPETLLPIWTYDWEEVFRKPWAKPRGRE